MQVVQLVLLPFHFFYLLCIKCSLTSNCSIVKQSYVKEILLTKIFNDNRFITNNGANNLTNAIAYLNIKNTAMAVFKNAEWSTYL